MRSIYLVAALVLFSASALAAPLQLITIDAVETNIDGGDLADTLTTDPINLLAGKPTNTISWTMDVTGGTTIDLDVSCEQSEDGSTKWAIVPLCDAVAPTSACVQDDRNFTIAGNQVWSSVWTFTKQYARCTFDDPGDGTGTLVLTGTRSSL